MLRATLFFFALATVAIAQNPLLTSSNTRLTTDTYGGGVSSLSGLPVGTADGTGSGQLALKTINVGTSTVTLSGSSEVVTPRTLTTGTLTLAANTTRFEFLVTQDFAASYITATGTTAVSGSGTIAYGIFANRAAPGRTLGASTIVITSGSGSGYDAH